MARAALLLLALALFALAGCTGPIQSDRPQTVVAPGTETVPYAYRPGYDATVQTVLQDNPDFAVGDRVHLTGDGHVIRL